MKAHIAKTVSWPGDPFRLKKLDSGLYSLPNYYQVNNKHVFIVYDETLPFHEDRVRELGSKTKHSEIIHIIAGSMKHASKLLKVVMHYIDNFYKVVVHTCPHFNPDMEFQYNDKYPGVKFCCYYADGNLITFSTKTHVLAVVPGISSTSSNHEIEAELFHRGYLKKTARMLFQTGIKKIEEKK